MTSRALAWRTVTANPARALLAVAGVGIIGALLFDMLLLSRGLLVSFRDLLDTAGYDVRVVATEGLPVIRIPIADASALVAELSRLPEVQEAAAVRTERAAVTAPNGRSESLTLINVSEGAERRSWRITKGENPLARVSAQEPQPLVVSTKLAKTLNLSPGSILRLQATLAASASALPAVMFRMVGIAEFGFEQGADFMAATTKDGFEQVRANGHEDDAEVVLVASRPRFGPDAAAAAISRMRPDLRAYSNEQIVAQFNQNGFAYFRQISFVLSTITLSFTFLLVATLLTVSVNQRLSEMAALRALGFPRQRIAATLLWESAFLVGVGGALALPIGGLLALQLDRILRAMPGIPEGLHFFVFEPRAVALHIALLALTGLAAAVYPMWVAARLPIAATLRRETVS